jgi:hypothetical protein
MLFVSLMGHPVADQIAAAARNDVEPALRVSLERIATEWIELIADENREGHWASPCWEGNGDGAPSEIFGRSRNDDAHARRDGGGCGRLSCPSQLKGAGFASSGADSRRRGGAHEGRIWPPRFPQGCGRGERGRLQPRLRWSSRRRPNPPRRRATAAPATRATRSSTSTKRPSSRRWSTTWCRPTT